MTESVPGRQQRAVALAYAAGSAAPTVVAKGRGLVAEQIIARAQEAGVFVHESKELVALLMEIDLDGQIPPALYRAIAELLAWLYHIESAQQLGHSLPAPAPPDSALFIDSPADSPARSAEQDASNA
ncbi:MULTISPECIES: EscU/YscU/HrcU family type III secretion system export apparatus switch protein [unclassified Massilia]|uniref:EscU/YscU/HrcU family type III secretion system export apparatus switch protein n=1 Tax=unclassified Massilia TaxID=2609279 RepID=UPI0017809888|nr:MULTISPECIES: EscU/YscU/HrcU family type III secretion system export apparatus switch protein [unclassified Massilia]MBD8528837.1 EscU/YscU/HrcU family type III secretion system export apparatus switch protein [Massilia sp. CFBP 13647]MBD8673479.1 EscU/YscU/HrcU family type III secretion system export apparatus switch protein [Massilia sp. CFBP 13721]